MTQWILIYLGLGGLVTAGTWLALRRDRRAAEEDTRDPNPVPRSLEGRIVICANCDARSTLYTSSSGAVVCSVCGSPSWLFQIPKPTQQLVNDAEEIRQLQYLYSLMPNGLPLEVREQWVADVKRRAEERVRKASGPAGGGA